MDAFATYRTFLDEEKANALAQVLRSNRIPCRVELTRPPFDVTFNLDSAQDQILVLVPASLFEEADRALEAAALEVPEDEAGSPFLKEFSEDELLDLVCKPQEWSAGDVVVARRMLAARGVHVDPEMIAAKKATTLAASRLERRGKPIVIAGAYLLSIGGGILGIVMGCSFALSRNRDAEGKRFHEYDAPTRRHGWQIILLGIGSFLGFAYMAGWLKLP